MCKKGQVGDKSGLEEPIRDSSHIVQWENCLSRSSQYWKGKQMDTMINVRQGTELMEKVNGPICSANKYL